MISLRKTRLAIGATLMVLGLTLSAQGQPVALPAKPVAKGKEKDKKDDRDWTESIHLPVMREAKAKIDAVNKYLDGKEAISAQRWEDIIGVLQGMLDDPTDTFVEIDAKGTKVSVRREVNRIIGTKFKDEGRQFYQRLIGPTADQKLKLAEEDNDMLLMAEVSQRYLHTKAGAAGTLRLAGWHLDRGRYMQALESLKLFMTRDSKDELTPQLLYRAAITFKRAGNDADKLKQAQEYWEKFEKATNKADLTINNKQLTYAMCKAEFDKTVPIVRMFTDARGLFRGNPVNNGIDQGSTPFMEPKFVYDYLPPVDDAMMEQKRPGFDAIKSRMEEALKLIESKGMVVLPGTMPLAISGKVIFRGYDGVYCVATREDKSIDPPIKPGELLWKQETDLGLLQMLQEVGKRTATDQFLQQYKAGPFGILFENPLIGSLSHDGNMVYFIDDFAVPPHPNAWQNARMSGTTAVVNQAFNEFVYFNRLTAVNLESGKREWKLGERLAPTPRVNEGVMRPFDGTGVAPKIDTAPPPVVKKNAENFLADAIFLGPPLPLAGKLYVVVEKDGLHLVCLDPSRREPAQRQSNQMVPMLSWTQKLGDPNGALPEDALRRYQAIHLGYKDGVLVVPTNAGAILGIELFSRNLIWAASYKSNKATNRPQTFDEDRPIRRGGVQNAPAVSYDLARERWHASAPIISGNRVVFTAFDSDTVECVDLHDGRPLWKNSIQRLESDLYVAGVFDEKVMIVGKGYVRFHSLATGAQLKEPINTGVPTGIGAATEGAYYLPIKASKDKSNEPGIVVIDIKTMQVRGTSRSRKKEAAGNLMFHDGDLISVTPSSVRGFFQLSNKIRETEDLLAKNAADPVGLMNLAMLQHDDGRLVPAIDNYRKSLAGKPPEELRAKGREKLFEAITELLTNDFTAGEKLLPEYAKLCEVEIPESSTEAQRKLLVEEEVRRKSNAHALIAKGKEGQGKLLEAFEAYMAYGTLVGNREMVPVPDDPTTVARPDVWARARIENMVKKATPEQIKPLAARVADEWKKVREGGELERLRGFVKVFGGTFEAGTDARIMLADRLSASSTEEDVREAEYMLLAMRVNEGPAAAARAVEGLARLYIRKGLLDDAMGMYAELGTRFGKTTISEGKTGADLFAEQVTDKRFLPYLESPQVTIAFPKLRQGEIVAGTGLVGQSNVLAVEMGRDALPYFRRYRLGLNLAGGQGWALSLTDRANNKVEWTSTGMGYPQWLHLFNQNNIPYNFVQVSGHVAVVTIHSTHPNTGAPVAKVYAFDVADRKKLWEIDLFGSTPNPILAANPGNGPQQQVEADGVRLTFQDGWSTKIGQQWVVQPTYTVVLTRDGLIAKDNARGTVLWTKANVSPRTHVIGDGEYVFAYDVNPDGGASSVRCYRSADGVEVTVPDSSAAFNSIRKARFFGRRVLAADDQDAKKSVRLYDLYTGKDVWKVEVPADGWVVRCDNPNYTGYATAAGDMVVLSIDDGKEVFRGKMDESKKAAQTAKINDALLLVDSERFYFVLSRPSEGNNRFGYNPIFAQGIRSVKVNGPMYAFDRASGKRLWHTAEQFEDMQIITDNMSELPIIIAGTAQQKFNANGNFEGPSQRLVAIDKATGKAKFNRTSPQQQQYYALLFDAKQGIIELVNYSGNRVRFSPDDGKPLGMSAPEGTAPPSVTPVIGRPGQAIRLAPAVALPAVPVAPPVVVPEKK